MMLHNICIDGNLPLADSDDDDDDNDDDDDHDDDDDDDHHGDNDNNAGDNRQQIQQPGNTGLQVRRNLIQQRFLN